MISAQEWRGNRAEFRNLDRNGDGVLSAEEYFQRGGRSDRDRRFREWDANRNNMIEGSEWHAPSEVFHALDRDGSSTLSYDEFVNGDLGAVTTTSESAPQSYADFQLLDRNRDGRVSRDEWMGSLNGFYELDRDGDLMLTPGEFSGQAPQTSYGTTGQDFREADTNRDGVISRSEWRGHASGFERLDRNNDGVLTFGDYGR